ncbi:Crooked neck-like protein 1 [Desmophyllum pertusum]|uniref:Crooked neck-like protein 1 n=1 Tax=Desmophyllum pertusum TaxID=174260 RepID=A0A9X0CYV0_9CNID|nr:Crooked neck-like protein 1 [Desmophyllum pertusum]
MPRVNQFWYKYTYMEEMLSNIAGARQVFERWMEWEPDEQAWHSYINMELRCKEVDRARVGARDVYERAVEFFGEENADEKTVSCFWKHDRVRVIFQYALKILPKEECQELYKAYTQHEKKYGDKGGIEDVIVSKRKFQYEEEVKTNPKQL